MSYNTLSTSLSERSIHGCTEAVAHQYLHKLVSYLLANPNARSCSAISYYSLGRILLFLGDDDSAQRAFRGRSAEYGPDCSSCEAELRSGLHVCKTCLRPVYLCKVCFSDRPNLFPQCSNHDMLDVESSQHELEQRFSQDGPTEVELKWLRGLFGDRWNSICPICMDAELNAVVVPCGHTCCYKCAGQLSTCHLCRADIITIVKPHATLLSLDE
jgi:hypothetical protein